MNKYDHSKKMSLFYRPTFTVRINKDEEGRRFAVDEDFVSFYWNKNTNKSMEFLSRIDRESKFGFGLHVHHEQFTECDSMSKKTKILFIQNNNNYNMDRARFRLYLNRCKEFMREAISPETVEHDQFTSGGWLFVHGKWGLNCSDLRVCRMEDEIQLLKLHGCDGDFSFPAGRRHCDPYIKTPFTATPARGFRIYDYSPSEAKPIHSKSNVMSEDRFFIWNSKLEHPASSLDAGPVALWDPSTGPADYLNSLLRKSVKIGDTLFIKTYAHSMEKRLEGDLECPYPMAHPDVLKMFDTLETLCAKNNVELNYVTASEVYNIFKKIDEGAEACM
jgi:hypothetical protein